MSRAASRPGSSGQTFLIVVLLTAALVPLLLLCFNIFLSARAKSRLVNAGDAAALAAAKWQGATLNLIGELNLSHLAAACDPALDGPSRTNVIDGINALAARIAFAGPVTGLWAANAAARKNFPDGALRESPGMRSLVQEEASFVRNHSSLFADELWPSRGEDYATMLDAVLSAGITVGADNSAQVSSFASVLGNHFYFQKWFYRAASVPTWQEFCRHCGHNHSAAIAALSGFSPPSADDLELSPFASFQSCGFFGVWTRSIGLSLAVDVSPSAESVLLNLWNACRGGDPVTAESIAQSGVAYDPRFEWFFLDPYAGIWREWTELHARDGHLALVGEVRPEYNVYGAMSAVRVENTVPDAEGGVGNVFVWRSAAKPFGAMPGGGRVTDLFGTWNGDTFENAPLVLPVFGFARLVTLGGVGAAHLDRADPGWSRHFEHVCRHVRVDGCKYCALLVRWEAGLFREGARWLSSHLHEEVCVPPGKGDSYDDDEFNN